MSQQQRRDRDRSPKRKCHVTLEVKAAQQLTLEDNNFNAQWWQAGCNPTELVVRMASNEAGKPITDQTFILERKVPFVACMPDTSSWADALLEARDTYDGSLQSSLTALMNEHNQNLDRIREQFALRIKEEDQVHEMRAKALRANYEGRLAWLHEQEQVIKALDKREGHWGPGDWPNYRMPLNLKDNQEDWENEEEPPKQPGDEGGKQAIILSEHSSSAGDDEEDSDDEEIFDNLELLQRFESAVEDGNKTKANHIAGIMSDRMEKEEDLDIMITDQEPQPIKDSAKGGRFSGGRSKSQQAKSAGMEVVDDDLKKLFKKEVKKAQANKASKKSQSYRRRR